jgi:Zn finger protein HypA/HybF involved in hydrogenase expression
MTLGTAAAARVRLVVWCKACGHRAEPDPAEQEGKPGQGAAIPDWHARLVCSACGSRDVDMVVTGTRRGD